MKNFSIFKRDGEIKDKQPTHSMSAKIGEEYVEIGSCWTKDGAKGKYLSCSLKKEYQDKPGFHIEVDIPASNVTSTPVPKSTLTSPGYNGEPPLDLADSPF